MNRQEAKELLPIIQAFADGKTVEVYLDSCKEWHPYSHKNLNLCFSSSPEYYRIAKSKPSIDWSHVAKEYRWLAVDEDGKGFIFSHKPYTYSTGWTVNNGSVASTKSFASYHCPPDVDWLESLVERAD